MGRPKGSLNKSQRKDAILTPEEKTILHDIVFKNKHFVGRDAIFDMTKKLYPKSKYPHLHLSRPKIMNFLKGIESYQLFHPKRQTKHIQVSTFRGANQQIAMDLIDMSAMESGGFHWILTAIDMYSRKSYVELLKNKMDNTVLEAFKSLLQQIRDANHGNNPRSVRSDQGSEFTNQIFKKYLSDNNIRQVLSSSNLPQSNGMIERFNGKLKRQIKMIKTQMDDNDWYKYVNEINNNLNNTYHRIIKMTPNELQSGTAEQHSDARLAMRRANRRSSWLEPTPFNVGDVVRIKLSQSEPYNFSRETYQIMKILKSRQTTRKNAYLLKNIDNDEPVSKRYYLNDLVLVKHVEYKAKVPIKHQISKIYKPLLYRGKRFIMVKWTDDNKPTWEPYEVIKSDAPKIVEKFEKLVKLKWTPNLEWDASALKLKKWPKDPPLPHVDIGDQALPDVDKQITQVQAASSIPTDLIIKEFLYKAREKKPKKLLYNDVSDIVYGANPNPDVKNGDYVFVLWRTSAKTNMMRIYITTVEKKKKDSVTVWLNPKDKKKKEEVLNDYFIVYTDDNYKKIKNVVKK